MSNERGSRYQAIIYQRGKSERLERYRLCLSSSLKDKKFDTVEERRAAFFIGAKLCSGKAKDTEEARKMCLEAHPEWKQFILKEKVSDI